MRTNNNFLIMSKNQKKVKINIFTEKNLGTAISFYLQDLKAVQSVVSDDDDILKLIELKPHYNLHIFLEKPLFAANNPMLSEWKKPTSSHYISITITKSNTEKYNGLIKLLQGNKKWQEFIRPSSGLGKEVILNFKFEHEE